MFYREIKNFHMKFSYSTVYFVDYSPLDANSIYYALFRTNNNIPLLPSLYIECWQGKVAQWFKTQQLNLIINPAAYGGL